MNVACVSASSPFVLSPCVVTVVTLGQKEEEERGLTPVVCTLEAFYHQ